MQHRSPESGTALPLTGGWPSENQVLSGASIDVPHCQSLSMVPAMSELEQSSLLSRTEKCQQHPGSARLKPCWSLCEGFICSRLRKPSSEDTTGWVVGCYHCLAEPLSAISGTTACSKHAARASMPAKCTNALLSVYQLFF